MPRFLAVWGFLDSVSRHVAFGTLTYELKSRWAMFQLQRAAVLASTS